MKQQVSVLDTTKRLLDRYCASVRESPDRVSEETEDLAYAVIYLVNRYADEFSKDSWVDSINYLVDHIGGIKTRYRDMVIYQAPLWCCLGVIEKSWYWIDKVLEYGLSQNSMGREIFLNYVYLVCSKIDTKNLLRYLNWYCREGKICEDLVLYLFMNSDGPREDKHEKLLELLNQGEVVRYPQVVESIKQYLNEETVVNQFALIDKHATNTILDFILFRDLTMTQQMEISLSED